MLNRALVSERCVSPRKVNIDKNGSFGMFQNFFLG